MLRVMLSLAILYVWTFSKGEYPRASRPRFAECIRCISTTALWAWGVYTTAVSAHVCYGAPTEFNLTHRHLPVAVAFASCFESFLALVAIAHCEKKAPIPKINKVATAVNSFFSFALCVFSIAGLGELLCEEVDFGVYILFLILSTLCRGFIVDWSAGLLGLRDNPEVRLQDMPGVGSRLIEGMKWAWGLRRRLRSPIAPECTAQEAEHEAARGLGGVGGAGDGTDTIDEAGEGNVVDTGVQMDEEPVQETADVASQTDPVVLVDELSQTDAVAVMDEASQTDNWFIKASRLRSATWPGQ